MDAAKTACLSLDVQNGILSLVAGSEACVASAARVVEQARKSGIRLIHVGIGFQAGYPEVPSTGGRWQMLKEKGLFQIGTESAQIHSAIYRPGDHVMYKKRVSGFCGTDLSVVLRAQKIENLVLFGIATSGIVLSTVREAADMDFNLTVISDACFDRDDEVHRVLTQKVFANQAKVMTAEEFVRGVGQ